jgi:Family of unknown function (DUF6519)
MKGDFTRVTFNPRNRYSGVLMQQGRVQLDSDLNENHLITEYLKRSLAADLIGPHGGPEANNGFRIYNDGISGDFFIGPGHYYVDGILCELDPDVMLISKSTASQSGDTLILSIPGLTLDERQIVENDWLEVMDSNGIWRPAQVTAVDLNNGTFSLKKTDQTPVRIRRLLTFLHQPDNPGAKMITGDFLAYLDVWERHITCLDDQNIREVALGGPDTSTRSQVVWQVNLMSAQSCADISKLESLCNAWMRARLNPIDPSPDPCIVAPNSKYRGAENLLYRVEIHDVGTNRQGEVEWTLKWSSQNGSIEAMQLGTTEDGGMIVNSTRGFSPGQWVEVTHEANELQNKPGKLVKITRVDADAIYLEPNPGGSTKSMWKLRRWDQRQVGDTELSDGAVKGKEGEWLDLENGIQVYFETGGTYCPGAFWYFPARVVTGQIQWPVELDPDGQPRTDVDGNEIPRALVPHGIQHHYAPLAMLALNGPNLVVKSDCRRSFTLYPKP